MNKSSEVLRKDSDTLLSKLVRVPLENEHLLQKILGHSGI